MRGPFFSLKARSLKSDRIRLNRATDKSWSSWYLKMSANAGSKHVSKYLGTIQILIKIEGMCIRINT